MYCWGLEVTILDMSSNTGSNTRSRTNLRYPFVSKVVGISNYQQAAARCKVGDRVEVKREAGNPYDQNAYIVLLAGECLGYLPRALAKRIVEEGGLDLEAEIAEKYDGKATIGVEILVKGASRDGEHQEHADLGGVAPSAATAVGPKARIVVAKRSGRVLGELTQIDRESRRVYVQSNGTEISYPDGLVDILES